MIKEEIKTSAVLNIDKIRKGEFLGQIPELYELREVIENNNWHDNTSVFDHTLTTLKKLEGLFGNIKSVISDYLNQKITNYNRRELLFLAAIFHDIAKKETFLKENGETTCLNHEEKGAIKAKKILSRFDLSRKEKDLVIKIIKYHNVIHLIFKYKPDKFNKEIDKAKKKYFKIFLEIILLSMADTLGLQPNKNKVDDFNFRINFYKKILF